MKPNLLRSAIVVALYAGTSLPIVAIAQEAGTEEAKELERVEVTGSRIKKVDTETAQPIQTITRADIEKSGVSSVFDVLNSITSSDGSGLSTVTTQTNGSDGSEQVSLRGFGAGRTLVLVDGKRWATDINQTVDLTTIPLSSIERIDVLKDGASAIYGSDAIAGVVNIITRKKFDGAQVGVYYGQTAKGDGGQFTADVSIGATGDRSSALLSISHRSQDPIFASDREISRFPFFGCEQALATGSPNAAACGSASGQYGLFTGGLSLNPAANLLDGITAADFIAFNNNLRYNFAPINTLQQPSERSNIYAYGRFDITDNISAYTRLAYNKRTSSQQIAEVPLSIANSGASGPQWQFPIAVNNIFNPFGAQINTANFRMSRAGPRISSYDYDTFSVQVGLDGQFSLGERQFYWDVMAQRNDGQYDTRGENFVNLLNLRNAVGQSGYDAASGNLYCGASYATRINGCVPFNIFGGPTLGLGAPIPGAPAGRVITQADIEAMLNYVTYDLVETAGNTLTNYTLNLSGDLFELPAGYITFATGYEFRKDDAFNQPDGLVAGGGSSTNFTEPTKGSTEVSEYYLELIAPLLKDLPFAKELELRAAARKSDYKASGFVGNTFTESEPGSPTNTNFSIKWKPYDDLLIRASTGETFKAPSANDLYSGGVEGFPQALDPCRTLNWANLNAAQQAQCVALGVPVGGAVQINTQLRALGGGNPNLRPEFGDNFSAGFVYSPSWLNGFNIAADYWRIDLVDVLSARGANTLLTNCHINFDAESCGFITRAADGSVSLIRTATFNSASWVATGVDLGMNYRLDTDNWGQWNFKSETTYFRTNVFNGQEFIGRYSGFPNWKYRSQFNIDWSKGDWSVAYTARYMSRLSDDGGCFLAVCSDQANNLNFLGATTYHDLQGSWKTPWKAVVSVGARNIFGKEPPLTANSFAHAFDASYDLPGGAKWYASYRQDF